MSGDTDSDSTTSNSSAETSSSSSDEAAKRKKMKKLKRKHSKTKSKKNKKDKKHHKDKKRKKLKSKGVSQPIAAPRITDNPECEDSFGPALPPHLIQNVSNNKKRQQDIVMIGPILPAELQKNETIDIVPLSDVIGAEHEGCGDTDVDDCTYGPTPTISSAAQIQLEERALELKIATIEGRSLAPTSNDDQGREEWMLELPDVGLKGGLAALSTMKRTFYQGKERPDFTDRSSWTNTPQTGDKQAQKLSQTSVEQLKASSARRYERERDEEQEKIAKKHKKAHQRDQSLVEMHQKKLLKEQKKRAKELAASGSKPERRPFSRDIDLKLNKIDSNQTKQIVDKAKILNTKFSSGKTKYL